MEKWRKNQYLNLGGLESMEFNKIKQEILESDFLKEIKEIWTKYTLRVVGFFIILLIVISTPVWDYIDGIVTTGTLVAVIINIYINAKNRELEVQKIKVFLSTDDRVEEFPRFEILRKDFTRAEISGYLSEIRLDSSVRFNINHLSTKEYFNDILNVQQNSDIDRVVIKVEKEQLKIFKEIYKDDLHKTNI